MMSSTTRYIMYLIKTVNKNFLKTWILNKVHNHWWPRPAWVIFAEGQTNLYIILLMTYFLEGKGFPVIIMQ